MKKHHTAAVLALYASVLALTGWAVVGVIHHYQARGHSDGLCTYTADNGARYKAECPDDYSGGN